MSVPRADLVRFAPHAMALIETQLEDREHAVVTDAVRALDSEEGLSPQRALEAIMAVREVRRLRRALDADAKRSEAATRQHAEALAR